LAILWLGLIGTPVSVGLAWWLRLNQNQAQENALRRAATLVALLSASINGVIYYTWLLYRLAIGSNAAVWKMKAGLADIGTWLVVLAFTGAMVGKGGSRIPIAICAVLGFVNWVPLAIL
jgi:hypothetical protein